jgi:hypothetical protein
VRVTLSGPLLALDGLEPAELRPYVTLGPGAVARAKVALDLPPGLAGVSVAEIDPPEVTLRIAEERNRAR